MNNSKKTKKALLSRIMTLVLCCAMLIGTTFAWFTDTAVTNVNKIQAGNLEVALLDKAGNDLENGSLSFKNKAGETDILWEPGATFETQQFKVVNKGNLALKFKIVMNGMDYLDSKLLEVIDFKIVDSNNKEITDGVILGTDANNKESSLYKIVATMNPMAGNVYQNESVSDMSITVLATQATSEYDINGNTYDEGATYPANPVVQSVTPDANGVYNISNAAELFWVAKQVNEEGNNFAGKTVKLTENIDLENQSWTPIGQTGGYYTSGTYFQGTFDGNEKTIYNLTVSEWKAGESADGAHYAAGLFGFIDQAGATIKNLTVDGATINGHHYAAVIAPYLSGSVTNCHVVNATVTCTHKNDNACGDKAGTVVGYVNNGSVTNCTAKDSTVKAGRDAGQIVGCATGANTAKVTDCTVDNVTVSATGDCTGANINNTIIGRTN